MKTTKTSYVLIVILAIICCVTVKLNSTPSYFVYLYDAAGNRIERIYIPDPGQAKRNIETTQFTGLVTISPNPATDRITVRISDISRYKETHLEIYDLNGNLLETKNNVSEETVFNLTEQNIGAYYISVTLDNSERKFKIMRIN